MATFIAGRSFAGEAEPLGLLSEGAAGIAAIVLAVLALAGISEAPLGSIITIVIGVGLLVQAFNSAAERSKEFAAVSASATRPAEFGSEVMVDLLAGISGIVLGVLALVRIYPAHLVPAALIVFGGALLLSGAVEMMPRPVVTAETIGGQTQVASYQRPGATGGFEVMVGMAAIVLGILSLILMSSWVLVLVGFIAIGAAMLMVSATFSGVVTRLFTTA